MQVAVDLPNDLVAFQPAGELRQEIRASHALWSYHREHA